MIQPLASAIWADVQKIRNERPLVLNLTNFVSMDFIANALLALGASPVMAHAEEELPEMVEHSKAVVINIGTLDSGWITSMQLALEIAKKHSIPTVLDPVGAGATQYRTAMALSFLDTDISILRGNASEVIACSGYKIRTKGVDSITQPEDALEYGEKLSIEKEAGVIVSGPTDYVFCENKKAKIENGHALMSKVTGMGCVASAVVAAFHSINPSRFSSALHSMIAMGIAGEIASQEAEGPAGFRTAFIDAIFNLDLESINSKLHTRIL